MNPSVEQAVPSQPHRRDVTADGAWQQLLLGGVGAPSGHLCEEDLKQVGFFFLINLFYFIYFWLRWVFVAEHRLSLVG